MNAVYTKLLFSISIIFLMTGCSSLHSKSVFSQTGPYSGVRNISKNYPKEDWGLARVPAMLVDLPFSAAADTITLPFDAWE